MKMFQSAKIPSNTAVIPGLLVLLMLLASFQYYWLGEISAGERERLQALVDSGAQRFSEDFDLEIASTFLGLQMQANTVRFKNWDLYAQRYDHWRSHVDHPNLVGDVYLVQLYERDPIKLLRYNPAQRIFEPSDWPSSMSDLRVRFEQSVNTMHLDNGMLVGNAPDAVADDVPALVIPVANMARLSDPKSADVESDIEVVINDRVIKRRPCPRCKPQPDPIFAYTVAALNPAYLWQQFVPQLAGKYFANGGSVDYNLAIVRRDEPTRLMYHSNSGTYELAPSSGDAETSLFSLRLDEINRLLIDDTLRLNDLPDAGDRPSWRIAVGRAADSPASDRGSAGGMDAGRWKLILTHRSGSLEAAVASLRLRNILISTGILALLGASMMLMVRSARRAQRLAEQKIEFVAAISHELRTPLAVICSAGENLADGVVLDPARARQYGAVIHGEGRRLAEMVDQALEFAGAQSGRKTYVPRPIGVNELIGRALAACQAQIRDADAQVDLRVPEDLPQVLADPTEMTRALQNLLRNAIKYGGERRWVGIDVCAHYGARGAEIAIGVHDNGMGIAPDDLAHIFEPFYRSREALVAQIHGSGLGLSLVQHIVRGHGGRVTVSSTLGHGSIFTIFLPCASNDGRQPAAEPA